MKTTQEFDEFFIFLAFFSGIAGITGTAAFGDIAFLSGGLIACVICIGLALFCTWFEEK